MISLPQPIRKLLKLPLILALRCGWLRRRIAFEIKHRWFGDLELVIPLSDELYCPVPTWDSFYSISEIFIMEEYGDFLREIPLPQRWIDLGCHHGYFTLHLAWRHAAQHTGVDWRALLIDADPRAVAISRDLLAKNRLVSRCELLLGLISREPGERDFALRDGMGSSVDLQVGGVQAIRRIRTITADAILAALPPPYDLLKIDIEGGEYDFLECYGRVLTHAAAVLLEWHASENAEASEERARQLLEKNGFVLAKTLRPTRHLDLAGIHYSSGVQLYLRATGQSR